MELMRRMSVQTLRHISCACASILMSSVKWNLRFFAVVENMTLCQNEREVQFYLKKQQKNVNINTMNKRYTNFT